MSTLVLPFSVSSGRVEESYRRANEARTEGRQAFAEIGMRLARAKNPIFLKTLEEAAEVMGKIDEGQRGETRRQKSTAFAESREATATQLFREAYRLADSGAPNRHFEWIYGAAAWIMGV